MNRKRLLLPLLLSIVFNSSAHAEESMPTCTSGDSETYAYQKEEDGHCEGIPNSRPISGQFTLISFYTGNTPNAYSQSLALRIPTNSSPQLRIQSNYRNYAANNFPFNATSQGFTYNLDTKKLDRANIPPDSLVYKAQRKDNPSIYLPVILGNADGQYNFVVSSPKDLKLPQFEIRRNGQVIYKDPRRISDSVHILTWKYGGAKAGRYELYLKDNSGRERSFSFEHNPNLL